MAAEQDQVLGHADEADGIEEYDNKLPTWWLGIFYFSIFFAIAYSIHYHLIAKRSQAGAYAAEIAAAEERWPAPEADELAASAMSPESLAAGEEIFKANCVACHGSDMKGGIGPDLTDAEWIHGGELEDITRTVTEGVPEKGMLTWGPILGPEKVSQVAAFVYSKSHGAAD